MTLNRVVAVATVVLSLIAAIAPVALNADWTSTAGIIAGLLSVDLVVLKWLEGWQKDEARVALREDIAQLPGGYRT